MVIWSIVVLFLAFTGIIANILWGTPLQRSTHDILLLLISLGILVRIRYKTKEGEKEKLKQKIMELKKEQK